MIKFAILVLALSVLCRWALGKWPWDYMQSPPRRSDRLRDARRVLGLDADATRTEIREAYRRIASDIHPDRGGDHARLAEITAARDTLLANHPDDKGDSR
ncbi:J domain-containing protein [Pseudoblastomonas halimionae]|uniref:DnaJ domain-containing protein n=1 Tax=Alteriqipengyuania halimionae TaxID=1926630 RepID=A0A6I4U839_9SPHN|nr:DnaJ domain-containing protein [Alteriqipengyuania halimionae]MXP10975.1 DnaJ domain-containing protein [Alteriqipengyuania halimionae]